MRTSNLKMIFLFFSILFIICLIIGLIFAKINYGESTTISNYTFNFKQLNTNNLIINLGVFSSSLILSFLGIGILILVFYFCYQIFILGFITYLLFKVASIKGILFAFWYVFATKLVFLILFISLFFYLFRITQIIFAVYIKKEILNQNNLFFQIKRAFFIILIIFFNDIILYFLGDKLIGIMTSLL